MTPKHTIIHSDRVPKAIGPYSQAVQYGSMLFCSGQIALNPDTMEIVEGGIREQTERVMENVKALLEDAGSGLDQILKCSIFLVSMDDFGVVNEVYGTYVEKSAPARETVAVRSLPKGVLIEVSVTAYV